MPVPLIAPILTWLTPGRTVESRCATCGEPIGVLPAIRIRGTVVHRDCLGYRARETFRGRRRSE